MAHVETKNLDGETNLKVKIAHKEVSKHFKDVRKIEFLKFKRNYNIEIC